MRALSHQSHAAQLPDTLHGLLIRRHIDVDTELSDQLPFLSDKIRRGAKPLVRRRLPLIIHHVILFLPLLIGQYGQRKIRNRSPDRPAADMAVGDRDNIVIWFAAVP